MGKNINELARLFKERENQRFLGITIGTVVSTSPMSVSIGKNVVVSLGNGLIVPFRFIKGYSEEVYMDESETKTIINYKEDILKVGDKVSMMPTQDQQSFYILDRVGG